MKHAIRRLQVFSDTVLAIAATVLAVPLAKIDDTTKLDMYLRGKPLGDILVSDYQLESFAMFLGSFVLVYLVWVRHGRQFSRLSREELAGDTPALVVTNLFELFLATLLPYTAGSASRARLTINYDDDDSDRRSLALPFCANVFALATTRVVFESLALRARHSIEAGYFNLYEAVLEMIVSMLILALASSVLAGEEIFLPFLAVPMFSATVRAILIHRYGEQEHKRMDWHRLEGFVDVCIAVVGTLMVLEIKPPVDCSDMKFETCVLHFGDGCRVNFENWFKPPSCYFERGDDQNRDIILICMYFVCFCLMVMLWYAYHEVIHQGYMLPKRRSTIVSQSSDNRLRASTGNGPTNGASNFRQGRSAEISSSRIVNEQGGVRSVVLSTWLCASIGLFPFAFSLLAEFAVLPYVYKDPQLFPFVYAPLDPEAGRTACMFALAVVLSASTPVMLLLVIAPRRSAIAWSTCVRVFAFEVSTILNLIILMVWRDAKLWPMFVLVFLLATSGAIGSYLQRARCNCRRCPLFSFSSSSPLASSSTLYEPLISTGQPPSSISFLSETSNQVDMSMYQRSEGNNGSVTPPSVASYRAATPISGSRATAEYVVLGGPVVTSQSASPPSLASSLPDSRTRNRRMSASQEYFSNFT